MEWGILLTGFFFTVAGDEFGSDDGDNDAGSGDAAAELSPQPALQPASVLQSTPGWRSFPDLESSLLEESSCRFSSHFQLTNSITDKSDSEIVAVRCTKDK
jgi:hypothetical protein